MELNIDNIEIINEIVIFNMEGRIVDSECAEKLYHKVDELVEEGKNQLILNFDKIDYINSSGLNSLIKILTKARTAGGELVIANVPEKIQKLLLITKLSTVFNTANSIDEAKEMIFNTIQS